MTLTSYFTLKSVFGQQGYRALTFALARLSFYSGISSKTTARSIQAFAHYAMLNTVMYDKTLMYV